MQSAKFESGEVLFPRQASWLAELEAEVFAFPQSRHDDQIDSISQALAYSASGYDTTLSWVR
jgi:predicted phage terminase large subunit-like protein